MGYNRIIKGYLKILSLIKIFNSCQICEKLYLFN